MMHLTGKTIEYQSLDHLHQHGTCTFFFFSSVLTEPELQTIQPKVVETVKIVIVN